jgi:acyl-CoA synthetase (AMP-forming)/AMP-acid ligase II
VVLNAVGENAEDQAKVKDEILSLCRSTLPRHKVPAAINIVPALAVAATGKLARRA